MNNAPIQEAAGDNWPSSWVQWFGAIKTALGGWRKTLTKSSVIDFPSIAAQSESSSPVSITGARPGDAVNVTPSANTAGIIYQGVVTANDTATIYAKNFTAGAINPASTTFHIVVFQN